MNEVFVSFDILCKLRQRGYKCNNARFEGHIYDVLKWLREEKKLHIELWTVGKKPIKWCHTITTLNHLGEKQGWSSGKRGDSYEAAAIAGIEYCLDNLI